jgi:serine/threonine protein kinase
VIGQNVGNYRIVGKIGEGGMGAVYRAEHALIGKRAAVKVLLPDLSRNPELVQRFFNEARTATSIHDPGIVEVFDYGHHTDGSAYIVMEMLDGEPLAARLARGRLHPAQAVRLMRQVARALAAAHGRGIIHRDLKPDNIHIVPDPEVTGGERTKILDFGIAKLADGHEGVRTRTGAVIGTPIYMSPEQCRGNVAVDHRADLYALGVIFFEMLCGRPPFASTGLGELFAEHMFNPPPPPRSIEPAIPPPVEALVLRLLAKDPNARFQRAEELVGALDLLEGKSPVPVPPPQPPPPQPPPVSGYAATMPSPRPLPPTPAPAPKKLNLWLVVGLPVAGGVLIIGLIFVALAKSSTSAYTDYMRKSKASEAEINLRAIRRGAETYRVEHGGWPSGTAGPDPPLGTCCDQGGKCRPDPSLWLGPGKDTWDVLQFSVDEPHYFSYEYVGSPEAWKARAYGDLDCDGTYTTYEASSDSTLVNATQPND